MNEPKVAQSNDDITLPVGLGEVTPGQLTPDQHRATLRQALNSALSLKPSLASGDMGAHASKCMALIEQGVPMSLNGPMSCFLEVKGWYAHEPLRELFAAYVRAGYIELNSAPDGVALPLEAAIASNHLDFFRAALEVTMGTGPTS
jgi:hypothetical protein